MLTTKSSRNTASYRLRDGFLNVVWYAGLLYQLSDDRTEGWILRSNNLNSKIRFRCRPGETVPSRFDANKMIKITARAIGRKIEGPQSHEVELVALSFDEPSIFDMPPRGDWQRAWPIGVPKSEVPASLPEEGSLPRIQMSDAANVVQVAGLVVGVHFVAPKDPSGSGALVVKIRQSKDADDVLICRQTGRSAIMARKIITLGTRLYVVGEMQVLLKNTGEAPVNGVLPVHRQQIIKVHDWKPGDSSDYTSNPDWVKQLMTEISALKAKNKNEHDENKKNNSLATLNEATSPVSERLQVEQTVAALDGANEGSDLPESIKRELGLS